MRVMNSTIRTIKIRQAATIRSIERINDISQIIVCKFLNKNLLKIYFIHYIKGWIYLISVDLYNIL